MKRSMTALGILATTMGLQGAAHAQITWVDRTYMYSIDWSGGDPMGPFTSGSALGFSDSGGPRATYQGGPFPQPDNFFGDGLFLSPEGGEVQGGWANLYFRNPPAFSGGHQAQMGLQYSGTGGSIRTFTVSASGEFIFSIDDARISIAHRLTRSWPRSPNLRCKAPARTRAAFSRPDRDPSRSTC